MTHNHSYIDQSELQKSIALRSENKRLTDQLYEADKQIAKLQAEVERLNAENRSLRVINEELQNG